MPIALFLACQEPELVRMEGVVWSAPGPDAPPLPNASVRIVDETGAALDAVDAGPDGVFRARVPAGIEVFAEIGADGYATTTFAGVTGLGAVFSVEDHALYGVTLADRDAELARFAGCPGADASDTMIVGDIRLYGLVDENGESPIVTTGVAGTGTETTCYLDADGVRYEPEAAETGDSGAFAIFGVEPGAGVLVVGYEPFPDSWTFAEYRFWIPAEGTVVSPWYPAWVELVL